MRSIFFSLIFLITCSCTQKLATITPFKSDYCSVWIDGQGGENWADCCFYHDLAYWLGGTESQRLKADQDLRQCVKSRDVLESKLMYAGVRIGGAPYFKTSFRWGFGWPGHGNYRSLTPGEVAASIEVLKQGSYLDWEQEIVQKFIQEKEVKKD